MYYRNIFTKKRIFFYEKTFVNIFYKLREKVIILFILYEKIFYRRDKY